ncbi:transmembrane protein 26 [Ciona intestinalis]
MCLDRLSGMSWKTPCGRINGNSLVRAYNTFSRIVKSILSRSLYALYSFIAVWRVTEALNETIYWLLLFTLCPLALETIHSVLIRKGNEMKWMTPSVLFYLLCGIPCIWLLEVKLLSDRLTNLSPTNTSSIESSSSVLGSSSSSIGITIDLDDEGWTLALEQILIFVLVIGKWIAPKGELSRNELSQLLLVNIAAGADIIELLEVFGETKVSQNAELVYLVMAIWTWSLLQFCLVLTASKDLPDLDDDYNETEIYRVDTDSDKKELTNAGNKFGEKTKAFSKNELSLPGDGNRLQVTKDNPRYGKAHNQALLNNQIMNTNGELTSNKNHTVDIADGTNSIKSNAGIAKAEDLLRADQSVAAFVEGRMCFDCFCCYTEIWGMVMSILFQDGPFLILRLFIMLHYKVVTHMNVFFTCKNVLVIILLLNRIRVIFLEERKPWKSCMKKYEDQQCKVVNERRRKLGLPPETRQGKYEKDLRKKERENVGDAPSKNASTPKPRKSLWRIWRA